MATQPTTIIEDGEGFSPWKDPSEEFEYRYQVPWDPDNRWPDSACIVFPKHRTGRDEQMIDRLTGELKVKFDRQRQREAQRKGELYNAELESITKASRAVAMIVVMQRDSRGLAYPKWMKQQLADGSVVPHPHAGKRISGPLPQDWIEALDPLILEHCELTLSDMYDPRSRGQLDTFQQGDPRLIGSPVNGSGPGGSVGNPAVVPVAADC